MRRGLVLASVALLALARPSAAQARPEDALRGLPVVWIDPAGAASDAVAIVLSGDGDWAAFIHGVSDALAQHGVGVAGLRSRSYLSTRRAPDTVAVTVERLARAAMQRYHATRFVVVGYSRGADLAPFAVSRMPPDLRAKLAGVVMFGLATYAGFQFHWSDLVEDTRRPEDLPILPELERLRGTPMTCVYGTDEKDSGCRDAPDGLLTRIPHKGGHSFGRPESMADIVLRAIAAR